MNDKISALKAKLQAGVTPAMATPLQTDGYTVNTAVIPALADFLIAAGSKGLFVGGTTGEGILLSQSERQRLHEESLIAANGRVPVILHVGANQLQTAVALARHAASLRPEAIVAVTPYFYGVDDDGLAAYFHAIAEAAPDIPLLLYDIPQLATNGISPDLLSRLRRDLPSLAGLKSSRPDAQMVRRLLDAAGDLMLFAGNEAIALGLLALGATGLISGLSTAVPEPFVALTQAVADGDLASARQQQQLINQLGACLPAARIGAIKQILSARGIDVGPAVPPRPMPTTAVWPKMAALLQTE